MYTKITIARGCSQLEDKTMVYDSKIIKMYTKLRNSIIRNKIQRYKVNCVIEKS